MYFVESLCLKVSFEKVVGQGVGESLTGLWGYRAFPDWLSLGVLAFFCSWKKTDATDAKNNDKLFTTSCLLLFLSLHRIFYLKKMEEL